MTDESERAHGVMCSVDPFPSRLCPIPDLHLRVITRILGLQFPSAGHPECECHNPDGMQLERHRVP